MERAGRVIYVGDLLIAAAAVALLPRKRLVSSDVERVGWSLIFVSFVPAFVFDSLFGSALPRLAVGAPETFPAFKSWFDLQFAVGLFVSPTLTGGTLGLAALSFGAFGVQIARNG